MADGASTTTATATVTDAQGRELPGETVGFSSTDPAEKVGAIKDAGNGTYTAAITGSTTLGSPTITASDGSVSGQATLTQTVGPPAKIAVDVRPGAIVADGVSTATATATVTDGQGHRVPDETIVFSPSDSGQFFGPVSTKPDGTYNVQIRGSKTVGQATITATDKSHPLPSAHATLTQAAGPSTTSFTATPSSLVTNENVTLIAVVTPSTGSPSGTVTFAGGGASIPGRVGLPITPSAPSANCQTSFAASTSPEHLTAMFTAGPTSTAPGSMGSATLTVNQDSPSVSLAVAGSVQLGQSTTYLVSVAPPGSRPAPTLPSGSVAFFDNGQPVGTCGSQPLGSGIASCTLKYNALGQHAITAQYSGDANFTGSASPAQTIRVVPVSVPAPTPTPAPASLPSTGSGPPTQTIRLVPVPASAPARVLGIVNSNMLWSFYFTPRYPAVRAFSVNGVSAAASVFVTCRGRGCPFANRTVSIPKPKRCGHRGRPKCPLIGTVNLASAFNKHRLSVGATLSVLIRQPSWIGKYYSFAIRARRGPRIQIGCLAPGSIRPGVGCSK